MWSAPGGDGGGGDTGVASIRASSRLIASPWRLVHREVCEGATLSTVSVHTKALS
jgi:hypothetical protein